jgi:chorismate mutase/prephenate dehydratase
MSAREAPDAAVDPVVTAFRDEITALDERLIETLNARLRIVDELRRYKQEHGIAFLDAGREAALVEHLQLANPGPLSNAAVAELARFVLDLVKQELADG